MLVQIMGNNQSAAQVVTHLHGRDSCRIEQAEYPSIRNWLALYLVVQGRCLYLYWVCLIFQVRIAKALAWRRLLNSGVSCLEIRCVYNGNRCFHYGQHVLWSEIPSKKCLWWWWAAEEAFKNCFSWKAAWLQSVAASNH